MSEFRVALCGQEQLIQQFISITPPHTSLRINNLSGAGPEAYEDAFRSYQFTVLMYEDQDPDALLWVHSVVRQHNRCHGASLIILAPVVVEHLGRPPSLLQEIPISINEPEEAFYLLDVIATAIAPRPAIMPGPIGQIPSSPGRVNRRPATPGELQQKTPRSQLRKTPWESLEVQMSTTQDIAFRWKAIQDRLRVRTGATMALSHTDQASGTKMPWTVWFRSCQSLC